MWTRENRGNYERKGSGYPSGLVDEEWSLVEPHLSPARRGFLINLAVSPASTQDRDMVAPLLAIARRRFQGLQRAIAGGGYQGAATADAVRSETGIPLEIVKRSDDTSGFKVLPKRWIVERTFGWLGQCRRLAKDCENLTRSHAAFFILAMIRLMLRRIIRLRKTF